MSKLDEEWIALGNEKQKQWEENYLANLRGQINARNEELFGNKNKCEHSILKGAVVGGIIAGPAGAVVGAIIQKDKNDRSK